jgi:hypothetical protein
MNGAHLHLAVNHLPVILVPVAIGVLAWAVLRKSTDLTSVGLGLLVIAAVLGGGVFLTGEPAEKVVEDLPGISKAAIEAHEEAAEVAAIVTGLAGLLGLGGLIVGRGGRQVTTWLLAATLIVALAAAGLMARAANLGGHIRHSEIAAARTIDEAVEGEWRG